MMYLVNVFIEEFGVQQSVNVVKGYFLKPVVDTELVHESSK